jgi:ribonucleotide reductase beta subunit family protein with ferritin-like domain
LRKSILLVENDEMILRDTVDQFVFIPDRDCKYYTYYKLIESVMWPISEVPLSDDPKDWDKLLPEEKFYIEHVIGFFVGSDGIVNANLIQKVMPRVNHQRAKGFYIFQQAQEVVHSEMYSTLLLTYIKDEERRSQLFNSIKEMPVIAKKSQWALDWVNAKGVTFAEQIIAFIAVEGIFFSGSFCAIYWIKKRGLLPGLTFSNELISRDEALHCEFACMVYNDLEHKLDEAHVKDIMKSACEIEKEFVTASLPVSLIGMNAEMACRHVEFITDFWLGVLGMGPIYGSSNPFEWMQMISLYSKSNFFERKVAEYNTPTSTDPLKSKVRFDDATFFDTPAVKDYEYAVDNHKFRVLCE